MQFKLQELETKRGKILKQVNGRSQWLSVSKNSKAKSISRIGSRPGKYGSIFER